MSGRNLVLGLVAVVAIGAGALALMNQPTVPPEPVEEAPVETAPEVPRITTQDHPNVLILLWDTVRADRLTIYGYDKPTTPELERFAARSTVFDRAVSPAIWTPPSHGSLFTGYAPSQHGVNAMYKWLDNSHVTLAEWLGEHGYQTYAFSANPYVSANTNLLQGFETTEHTFEPPWKRAAKDATKAKLIAEDRSSDISPDWTPPPGQKRGGETHPYKDAAPVIHQAFTEWLDAREQPDRPFFAYLNFMETHIPRVPSIEARRKVMSEDDIALSLVTDVSQIQLLSYIFGRHDYTEDELRAINGVYDAALVDLDTATGALLADLEQRGLLENTVVILTSDHGENLGDHHMFGHKFSIWNTLLNVPLVIYAPDRLPVGRVTEPVSNLDLFATILDLARMTPPETPYVSRSLLDPNNRGGALFAEMTAATPVAIRRVDDLHGDVDQAKWLRTFKAVERDGIKLIEPSEGGPSLYDLNVDPGELNDLATAQPDTISGLRASLERWLGTFTAYDGSSRTEGDKAPDFAPSTKKMLRSLGYVDDEGDEDGDEEGGEDEGLEEDAD